MILSQLGGVLLYGSAEREIPFPLLCMRPMVATLFAHCHFLLLENTTGEKEEINESKDTKTGGG